MERYQYEMIASLERAGIAYADAIALRRISMTLNRWFELECGDGTGYIERDEATGKPYWANAYSGRRSAIADREAGALRRLAAIMARYPDLVHYVQGDCRGASLYILRRSEVAGLPLDQHYSRGIAVCK